MCRKLLFLVPALVACLSAPASAQVGSEASEMDPLTEAIRSGRMRPFVQFDYGMGTPQFEGLGSDFQSVGMMELKLGYAAIDSVQPKVVKLLETFVFGSSFSEGLGTSGDETDVRSELSRFGAGNRFGYGIQGKSLALDFYNQNGMGWTEVEAMAYEDSPADAQAVFDRYGSTLRFGQVMEAGLKLRFSRSLALNAGLEGAIIYPRYVFWPWLGSIVLYSGVQGAVERFSGSIVESSPVLGPVIYFALKTGISYAFYTLSQEDMNWPFEQETPLTVESFKVGATLRF